jgi:hypothetical protein
VPRARASLILSLMVCKYGATALGDWHTSSPKTAVRSDRCGFVHDTKPSYRELLVCSACLEATTMSISLFYQKGNLFYIMASYADKTALTSIPIYESMTRIVTRPIYGELESLTD